jgi:2-hydroxychromene-2-carboxylate isomerase
MPSTLEFFFDYSSPYSYLASTQVQALGERNGAIVKWRPFLLGAVFKATGNVPPSSNLAKAQYLLKDLSDWIRHYRLPELVWPPSFPMNSVLADRLGLVAEEQGKLIEYTRETFHAAFAKGQDISEKEVLYGVLVTLGMEPEAALARATSQEIKDRLRANTDEAVARGAFGAPTFFVGEDMYVGNDRLPFVERALTVAGRATG